MKIQPGRPGNTGIVPPWMLPKPKPPVTPPSK